jgi:prepilin-type N-terminal cleavage/methylation domain-containing protein
MNRNRFQKGFTLVEVIIILFIIAILASIVVPKFFSLRSDALSASKAANSSAAKSAYAIYIAENEVAPTVAELATDVAGATAVAAGIQVEIDGANYTVPTYTNTNCSIATSATTQTVLCIGQIP